MLLIDTHTHLYMPEFEADDNGGAAVQRAVDAGVGQMIFPNCDLTTIVPMRRLAARFPGVVSMAMGLHPTEVGAGWRVDLEAILRELGDGTGYVAVGEIGIDLYWDATYAAEQMRAFDMQVARASELDLPVIIHCREGLAETLKVLRGRPGARGVFHSFGGTADDVRAVREVGDFYFGINGVVTFKNCTVRDALAEIGLDRLLLETDSPYLAPVPHRGRRNESAYITHVAHYIAQYLGVPVEQVAEATTRNARALFAI